MLGFSISVLAYAPLLLPLVPLGLWMLKRRLHRTRTLWLAEVRRLSQEDGRLLELAQEPMPRVLKKWVVSEAFLRTLPRTHLRHVEAHWWSESGLFR